MQRNFALDGLRALAIMLVFTAHAVSSFGAPALLSPLQFGGSGVDLFFVLSGWLIGNQIFNEKKRYGNIEVKRFWVRRWMRTLPAYYAVLFAQVLQQYLTKEHASVPIAHVVFLQNYLTDLSFFTISWSLAVEEQFYLMIAPLMVLVFKCPGTVRLVALMGLLLLPSLFRWLGWFDSLAETHVRLDCCAMGVLLAYVKHYQQAFWSGLSRRISQVLLVSVAVYLFFYVSRYNASWYLGEPSKLLLAVIFGIWVIWSDKTRFSVNTWWQHAVMFISTRSYAMYLLHVDALAIGKRLFPDQYFVLFYAATLALTLLLAEVLYRAIELPVMNARKNFALSRSRRGNVV